MIRELSTRHALILSGLSTEMTDQDKIELEALRLRERLAPYTNVILFPTTRKLPE